MINTLIVLGLTAWFVAAYLVTNLVIKRVSQMKEDESTWVGHVIGISAAIYMTFSGSLMAYTSQTFYGYSYMLEAFYAGALIHFVIMIFIVTKSERKAKNSTSKPSSF